MSTTAVHRIEVRPRAGRPDPRGDLARREAEQLHLEPCPERIEATSVYLIEGDLDASTLGRVAEELLADPVTEEATIGTSAARGDAHIEVHPLPGVMDPEAEPIEDAIRALTGRSARVRTGRRFDLHGAGAAAAREIAERTFANPVIHDVHDGAYHPDSFPEARPHPPTVPEVPIDHLDDDAMLELSRSAHLFLSLAEMQTIQAEYRRLGRPPRAIELETLAQTWSEHCVHKTLKADIRYVGELPGAEGRPGITRQADGSLRIDNLLRSTVAAATHELMADGIDWCLSVFVDNAGIIAFDEKHAVCFKVETHNHPSAIEPYGGAATGIGGCIRDIIGTGLAAEPIAATDIFCVGPPEHFVRTGTKPSGGQEKLPAGCLHPQRVLRGIVAGVRDYGNRMGIPTLNGAVSFDADYVGNPLVYCGCVGVMPRDLIAGDPAAGDLIVALGGRTGRDGIHGATFSSAELTVDHADEFSHAVQIGNAVTEKKVLDAILEARDQKGGPLFRSITDCGAGGFSSAVGEMGEKLGAEVHLERAPLKYAGLSPTEVWISEAQERMVLAVPQERLAALEAICAKHDVEACTLGTFGTPGAELILRFQGEVVGQMPMAFLHDGLPPIMREASWTAPIPHPQPLEDGADDPEHVLRTLLADENIASKHWIIRQYDHEVQGRSVIKPLVGPGGNGPGDGAVIQPVRGSSRGLGMACGLSTGWRDDPYLMALAAIDECVRNLVCVGVDPETVAILDNFCWPGCDKPELLGSLVRASVGCYDGAKAYRTPFISGKDSLNNQFQTDDGRTIRIPPTLLISGFGIVPDIARAITMDAKRAGNRLLLAGPIDARLGGSHYVKHFGLAHDLDGALPEVDLAVGPRVARGVHALIQAGVVKSAHDVSDGGLLVAAFEMAMAGGLGVQLELPSALTQGGDMAALFGEAPSRYLLEVDAADLDRVKKAIDAPVHDVGWFKEKPTVDGHQLALDVAALQQIWLSPLDW